MNLIIDIGNSRTKIALFNDSDLMFNLSLDELTPANIKMLLDEHPSLDKAILSATKPFSPELKKILTEKFSLFIELDHQTLIPIENLYESKETLGKDRLATAIGANELFPDQNLLIIDAGTAITFDLVNSKNQFLGGNISPGLEMRFKALNTFTGKLPLVEPGDEFPLFGRNTPEAIRSGVQNGILFEVEQYIQTINKNYENLKVIITGGDAKFFDKKLKNSIFVHFNLTLIGLNRILEFNNR
ncbi:MAG: type III pantothenate kinase [Prolixibacteraceae bacterium]|jgi:type III pantothenate kinase|nr:type III pantothenate kinase [Prolixibacteraceae bacterium]